MFAVLQKFLNYTEESRNAVSIENLLMATIRDVTAAVNDGYVAAVDLVFGSIFKLALLIGFMFFIRGSSDSFVSCLPIIAVCLLPPLCLLFLNKRWSATFSLGGLFSSAESASLAHLLKSVLNYQVSEEYRCLRGFRIMICLF